jgi:hypothetical protein
VNVLQALSSAQTFVFSGKEFWKEENKKNERNKERKKNTERTDIKKEEREVGSIG